MVKQGILFKKNGNALAPLALKEKKRAKFFSFWVIHVIILHMVDV